MSSITVTGLGKAYKQYPNRWSRLLEWILPFHVVRHNLKWVLEDINFAVQPGEAVGIIGVNGAGKSTLLKLITGTTQPTTGSVQIHGRMAALLELGMGFHPDFSGRQNAFMAGQLLGMRSDDIARLMPEIVDFAEIGDYIDQPVRVYSSGMQMRLAFGVATATRPDILIVDEALSVGDAYFQHKSFERIREFREQGTTLLIVSHDKQAIQSICDRAILLSGGRLSMEGKPEAVMDYYNALLAGKQDQSIEQHVTSDGRVQTVSGTGEVQTLEIRLSNQQGDNVDTVDVGQNLVLDVLARADIDIPVLVFGFSIKDRLGQTVYGINTALTSQELRNVKAGSEVRFRVHFPSNLGPSSYSIQTSLSSGVNHYENNYEWRDLALVFNVVNMSRLTFAGVAWLDPVIEIESLKT